MRKILTWTVLVAFISMAAGCADNEHMTQYYNLEQARTEALIESMEKQSSENAKSRALAMQTYSKAMSSAAITADNSDDVAVALAWGYYMGAPQQVNVPKLSPVKAPPTNVDYIRAWSPIIGMTIPLLWGAVWSGGTSGSGSGNSYSADNGGSIVLDSGNPGSYNSIGGDQGLTVTQSDYSLIRNDSCADGDCGEDGGEVGGQTLPADFECTTDGYLNTVTGKWYTSASQTCSCGSYEAGVCT